MAILTVVLGVIFVLLMLSLLATTIMELIASFLRLRGKNLKKALQNMLVGDSKAGLEIDRLYKSFTDNPLFKQLSFKYGRKSTDPPSYVSAESFRTILFDVLLGDDTAEEQLGAKIDELDNEDLKRVLKQLMRQADNKIDVFKTKVDDWYNSIMDRASGWYKRTTHYVLIWVGLVMAVVLNADTLALYEHLENDPETLTDLVSAAETLAQNENIDSLVRTDLEFADAVDQFKAYKNEVDEIKSPLGMGWKNTDLLSATPYDWLTKVLGWVITALAVSLGAPFWFDILKKIVSIRSSGNKPQ
ncbi:MAG TPA: hypothetical protein PKE06_16480 [Flavilitoribacter sp.]|nr:hypothetical protein [Flavilitoribacter sp.]HMQ89979.1 hypothetical protein [Flavilitoribacter sp.]